MNVGKLLANEEREQVERWVRSHAQTAYLGEHLMLCRVLGEFFCQVDTRDLSLSPHLMLDGFWEMWITQAVARHVRPGMVCIDVGACFGYYTLLLADLVGPTGQVQAYEPNPECARMLQRSIAMNGFEGRVALHEIALGGETRISRLQLTADRWGDSKLTDSQPPSAPPVSAPPFAATPTLLNLPVQTQPLDSMVQGFTHVDLIKIDAEGSEPDIWVGMQATLQRSNPLVLMEFAPRNLKAPEALLAMVEAGGYELALVDEQGLRRPTSREYLLGDGEIRTLWLRRE